jgi:hypothetical protein
MEESTSAEDIKAGNDPQLLKWFRSSSSAKTKSNAC